MSQSRKKKRLPKHILAGRHRRTLGPRAGCSEKLKPEREAYPTDFCDTRVTVNGVRAGLQFVGGSQINIKLPGGIPSARDVAIVVAGEG